MNTSYLLAIFSGLLLWAGTSAGALADVVLLRDGAKRTGKILGAENGHVQISYRPVSELPEVCLRIPLRKIAHLEFAGDPVVEQTLKEASPGQLGPLEELWRRFGELLEFPTSPASDIGLRYGLLLLGANQEEAAGRAYVIFSAIAERGPSGSLREAGRQGILRALLAARKLDPAVREAHAVLGKESGPALRAEALLTLAIAASEALEEALKEHPRWREDDLVRSEVGGMREGALNGYLGAALSQGAPAELVQRGLWGAFRTYRILGEVDKASEIAADLSRQHPQCAYAHPAREWLAANPPKEKEAVKLPSDPQRKKPYEKVR